MPEPTHPEKCACGYSRAERDSVASFYDHLVVRDGDYIDTDKYQASEFVELVREALREWHKQQVRMSVFKYRGEI